MHVAHRKLRMLDGHGRADYPRWKSHFVAHELQGRRIREHGNINCQWGIRLGVNANGEDTNHLQGPNACRQPVV